LALSTGIEFGLGLQSDKSAEEYIRIARVAEEGGFDVVSVFHDLGFQPAIVPLTLIAHATERVRLGPAALNPYTLHPFEIASQIAALDLVARGRAYLGLVQGAWLDELGITEQRLGSLREAVEVVRRVLRRDTSGFRGRRFQLAPGRGLMYEPVRPAVPLMIGTWRPRTAALAGELADEVKIGGCANPDMVRQMRRWIGNEHVGVVAGAVTFIDEDGTRARARAREEVELYLPVVRGLDVTLELEPEDPIPLEKFVFAGTPAEIVRQTEGLLEAGVRRIEFGPPQGETLEHGVRLLVERVLPAFRT
jgi:5,10-methylenetetrahydromethanopterin reductase